MSRSKGLQHWLVALIACLLPLRSFAGAVVVVGAVVVAGVLPDRVVAAAARERPPARHSFTSP